MSLTILTVKNGADQWLPEQLNESLAKSRELVIKSQSADLIRDYNALHGVVQALWGDLRGAEDTLNEVLTTDSNHRIAKAAMEVLRR